MRGAACFAFCILPFAFFLLPSTAAGQAPPQPGLTAAPRVARAYDLILNADFDGVAKVLPQTCPPAPEVACLGLEALSLWWQIQLDPHSRRLDGRFMARVEAAIAAAKALTEAEPRRAEAWFYLGAAYGARAQFRVHRAERLAAARDGKRIKEALERALALDPAMHDAEFGIGMYRYYADVAPAVFRFLRWLLLLPGGDREGGLAQLERAGARGLLVGGEARYQIHVLYLWYEQRFQDALAIIRELQARYPKNPLFHHSEAEILDTYVHDAAASLAASERLLALATAGAVHRADIAAVNARLNMARQLIALDQPARAAALLEALIAAAPPAPDNALARARALRRTLR
jgi:tetratricopeptide (TPR) repeat protein